MAWKKQDVPLAGAAILGYGKDTAALDAPQATGTGRLSEAMRSACAHGPMVPLVTATLPTGTKRIALSGFFNGTRGQFSGGLLKLSGITNRMSDRGNNVAQVETSFEVDDHDRFWARLLEGQYARSVMGSAVMIEEGHALAPSTSWVRTFTGVITKIDFPTAFKASIVVRTDDLAFRRDSPKGGWVVSPALWPNSPEENRGRIASVCYGLQSSQGHTQKGLVELVCVDTIANVWLIGAGPVGAGRLYDDNGPIATTGYEITRLRKGGRLWTIATFDAAPTGTVSADITGFDLDDYLGSEIGVNPALQLAHYITNFVDGDWKDGDWLPMSPLIDTERLTEIATLMTLRGYRGGVVIDAPATGYQILTRWLGFEARAWWTEYGKLALKIEDPCALDEYAPRAVFRQPGAWKWGYDDQSITPALTVNYDFQRGSATSSMEIVNPKRYAEASDSMELTWLSHE